MSNATKWGLPPEFAPARFPISDDAKAAVRPLLTAGDPVVISLANDEDAIALVGTPQRLLVVKISALGAGAAGVKVREFPWQGIARIVATPLSFQLKIALHYRSSNNGRTVEVGRRAKLADAAVENLAGFDLEQGNAVFAAMLQIWESKRERDENDILS